MKAVPEPWVPVHSTTPFKTSPARRVSKAFAKSLIEDENIISCLRPPPLDRAPASVVRSLAIGMGFALTVASLALALGPPSARSLWQHASWFCLCPSQPIGAVAWPAAEESGSLRAIRPLGNTFALSPGRLLRRSFKEDRSVVPARLTAGTPGQQVFEFLLNGFSNQLFYERLQAFQQIWATRSPSTQKSIIIISIISGT